MTDIVERLREQPTMSVFANIGDMVGRLNHEREEAADEIERLRGALQQFLHVVQAEIDCCKDDTTAWYRLCFATLDKARAALGEKE